MAAAVSYPIGPADTRHQKRVTTSICRGQKSNHEACQMYLYTHTHTHTYIYIYIYIYCYYINEKNRSWWKFKLICIVLLVEIFCWMHPFRCRSRYANEVEFGLSWWRPRGSATLPTESGCWTPASVTLPTGNHLNSEQLCRDVEFKMDGGVASFTARPSVMIAWLSLPNRSLTHGLTS